MVERSHMGVSSLRLVAIFIAVFGLLIMPSPVNAETSSFAEDFTTTTFMDVAHTNATGWGSGSVKLPSRVPTLEGSCSFPGVIVDIAIEGRYMYVTDGAFHVMNITDPVHPTQLGSVSVSGFIWVEGDYAYVSEGTKFAAGSTLRVVNLTDPTNPVLLPNGATGGGRVSVSGNYAYCASGTAGLRIVNITDPSKPALVSTVPYVDSGFQSVCVSGDYAYVAEDFDVRVVNVTDPVHPAIISSVQTDGDHRAIAAFGLYVMVAGDAREVEVMDVSNPHNPRPVEAYSLIDRIWDMQIDGHYAYLATWWKKLVVIDISNPLGIAPVESWGDGDSDAVCVSGGYAYVVDNVSGIVNIIAISDPTTPTSVGLYVTPSMVVWDVFVSGSYAYVANANRMIIVDVTDPESPEYAGNVTTPGTCRDVYVSGQFAYAACGSSGLQVINISDSSHPSIIGSYSAGTNGRGIYVEGDYAYMADDSAGLRVFNVTNPSLPSLTATCATGGLAYSVFIDGNHAYIACHGAGLAVVNITDPRKPNLLKVYDTPDTADGVFVSGDMAYVADGNTGLIILSISDPANPTYLGTFDTPAQAWGIDVSGGLAYVSQYIGSSWYPYIDVVNVTNPINPTLYARTGLSCSNIYGICVDGEYVYVADYGYGLRIGEVRRNRYRQFEALAVAQSTAVFNGSASSSLSYATLDWTGTKPAGCEITFFLSPDNGLQWETVLPGVRHDFVYSGRQLVWKSVLTCANHLRTPVLSQISISFTTVLDPPSLLAPSDSILTNDSTPTFEWSEVSGASGYLLQIDKTPTFDSVDLLNVTVTGATSHTLVTLLPDGIWYWRVATNDTGGDLGRFSSPRQMSIDATAPDFDEAPVNWMVEFGTTFRCDLNASDSSGLDMWWLNDTSYWHVDGTGVITNSSLVPEGVYGLRVFVNDTAGNQLHADFQIDVLAGAPPAWVQSPANQIVELGDSLIYDLNATDFSGIDAWWLNDTLRFIIDQNGVIRNKTVITTGQYGLQVWVNDTIGYVQTALFFFRVCDTTAPDWIVPPVNQVCDVGCLLNYELSASDLSGLHKWWLNDTAHFGISEDGVVTSLALLPVGTYGLRVWVNDTIGNTLTAAFTVVVQDILPPAWVEVPVDQVVEFGSKFRYNLNATDPSGVVDWWINDTLHFAIDSAGIIVNVTGLSVNVYSLEVRVNDSYDHCTIALFVVSVQDTTPPAWVVVPHDEVAEFGQRVSHGLYAYDLSGLFSIWINDTIHFELVGIDDITGFHYAIENKTPLQVGEYGLEVRIYDFYNNYCAATFVIAVEDTTPPAWLVQPVDKTLSYGLSLDYQLEAFDLSGVVLWLINDTIHFAISSSGHLTNATILSSGRYGVTVTVSDPYGNALTGVFAIHVSAATTETATQTTTGTTTGPDMSLAALVILGGGIAMVVVVVLLRWSKSSLRQKAV
ncbi:MAG: hypothetical protein C4K49_12005 [Candidatus Thorarchaeota archaeon]|nr:MAG: hypothetical protein C4K49_12005 [Candidatus Thorarchaeota archaeon]